MVANDPLRVSSKDSGTNSKPIRSDRNSFTDFIHYISWLSLTVLASDLLSLVAPKRVGRRSERGRKTGSYPIVKVRNRNPRYAGRRQVGETSGNSKSRKRECIGFRGRFECLIRRFLRYTQDKIEPGWVNKVQSGDVAKYLIDEDESEIDEFILRLRDL